MVGWRERVGGGGGGGNGEQEAGFQLRTLWL